MKVSNSESADVIKPDKSAQVVEEFSVADYYLIRGNKLRFKIYPLTNKRGKCTSGVEGCIYEYDGTQNPIVLWNDAVQNSFLIRNDLKPETVLSFATMLLKINMPDIYQYDKLAAKIGMATGETLSLFDLLRMMSKLPMSL